MKPPKKPKKKLMSQRAFYPPNLTDEIVAIDGNAVTPTALQSVSGLDSTLSYNTTDVAPDAFVEASANSSVQSITFLKTGGTTADEVVVTGLSYVNGRPPVRP